MIKVEAEAGADLILKVDRFKEGHGRVEYIVDIVNMVTDRFSFSFHGLKATVKISGEVEISSLPKPIKGKIKD